MSGPNPLINFDGQTLFQVGVSETYTVGDSVSVQSPSGQSSGVSPTTTFNTQRRSVGGAIFAAFTDAAGPSTPAFVHNISPGDVIAVSAIASGAATVTINGVTKLVITATAVAGVIGFWA